MSYDFITIGGATEDISFYTKEGVLIDNEHDILRQKLLAFEFGAKINIDKTISSFGGGAANSAVSFSRLGYKTATFLSIGDDQRGKMILTNFRNQGVDTKYIAIDKGSVTGYSFILIGPGNEHIIFSDRAANNQLQILSSQKELLGSASWVYISSVNGKWMQQLAKVFSWGSRFAWNPGGLQISSGVQRLGKFMKKTEILMVNKDEAIELYKSSVSAKKTVGKKVDDIRNLLSFLSSCGPKIVLITDSYRGAHAFDGKQYYFQEALSRDRIIDTTGVGDSFCSSFVAGFDAWGDIKKALYLAAKNAGSVVRKQGAQNGLIKLKVKSQKL